MIFGPTQVATAKDCILAHSVRVAGTVFKKGRRLSAADTAALTDAGIDSVLANSHVGGTRVYLRNESAHKFPKYTFLVSFIPPPR